MQSYLAGLMIVLGILLFLIGVITLQNLDSPPKLPLQYPGVAIHNEGNKTIFRYDDGSDFRYDDGSEYKDPKSARQNSSKIVSVDSDGFTISTPKRKEKND